MHTLCRCLVSSIASTAPSPLAYAINNLLPSLTHLLKLPLYLTLSSEQERRLLCRRCGHRGPYGHSSSLSLKLPDLAYFGGQVLPEEPRRGEKGGGESRKEGVEA